MAATNGHESYMIHQNDYTGHDPQLPPPSQPPMPPAFDNFGYVAPPDDISAIFEEYKRTWFVILESCGSNDSLRITSLETMVDELLEHNGLLVGTIMELQRETASRVIQMERRLTVSAKSTEEAVIGLDRYSRELKRVIGHRVAQVDAADIIDELTNHLEALKIENSFLRDKNDNLKHDMGNLLEIVKFERNRSQALSHKSHGRTSSEGSSSMMAMSNRCLTFCDSVNPEDVYGPIEACVDDTPPPTPVTSPGDGPALAGESNDAIVSSGNQLNHSSSSNTNNSNSTASSSNHENYNSSSVVSDNNIVNHGSETRNQLNISRNSTNSSSVNHYQSLIEEKELLLADLQQHLSKARHECEFKDQVIKNIEAKLDTKRAEFEKISSDLKNIRGELDEQASKIGDLSHLIKALNEDKRKLMTQLDEQSEDAIKAKQEVLVLSKKLIDANQEIDNQAMTIEHLKEAIISKTRSMNTGFGLFSAPTSLQSPLVQTNLQSPQFTRRYPPTTVASSNPNTVATANAANGNSTSRNVNGFDNV